MTGDLKMRISYYLEKLLGKENVTVWWLTPNKAFSNATPNETYLVDPDRVKKYVLDCAGR